MSLSTHVLDAALGRPAAGMAVRWETRDASGSWRTSGTAVTDGDGRVPADAWMVAGTDGDGGDGDDGDGDGDGHAVGGSVPVAGRHRLVFDIENWSATAGFEPFFPEVTITFVVGASQAGERLHVPLLLSPYAYSTYRGS